MREDDSIISNNKRNQLCGSRIVSSNKHRAPLSYEQQATNTIQKPRSPKQPKEGWVSYYISLAALRADSAISLSLILSIFAPSTGNDDCTFCLSGYSRGGKYIEKNRENKECGDGMRTNQVEAGMIVHDKNCHSRRIETHGCIQSKVGMGDKKSVENNEKSKLIFLVTCFFFYFRICLPEPCVWVLSPSFPRPFSLSQPRLYTHPCKCFPPPVSPPINDSLTALRAW